MNILAIIPARSGSKSVVDKNIREIGGIPMLAWSIRHAKQSKYINRIILSTDSEKYAAIGREYGAETPFIRPAEYATDTALDIEVFEHALKWLKENENYEADIVVQLRPTYPKRNPEDIDKMIEMLINDKTADAVRSVALAGEVPYKMWLKGAEIGTEQLVSSQATKDGKKTENDKSVEAGESKGNCSQMGVLSPLITSIPECYNMPRQELPTVYYQNACIDVMRSSTVLEKHSMTGDKILGYYMAENLDIDTEIEFLKAELEVLREKCSVYENSAWLDSRMQYEKNAVEALKKGGKRLVFDIDGVIARLEPNNNYALSEPATEMIESINRLYDAGNYIVLNTARGYVTGKDWSEITTEQLSRWGLKYHELHFGKPNADYYVDDKMLDMNVIKMC